MQSILKDEATAELREITVLIQNGGGVGVAGLLLADVVLKLGKVGGNFGASAGATLTEITGGIDVGIYALRFHATDVNTVGDLRYELTPVTPGAFTTTRGVTEVRPPMRTVDVADGILTNAKIADGFLTAAKLAADTITNAKIADGFLTAAKVAADTLTNAKIADGFLTAAKLSADTITNAKVADGLLTAAKFAANSIIGTTIATTAADKIGVGVWGTSHATNHAAGSMGDQILGIMMACGHNVIRDTITNGSEAGIVTIARVRCWITAAGVAAGVAAHANDADAEDARGTFTAVDAGAGLITSQKLARTL